MYLIFPLWIYLYTLLILISIDNDPSIPSYAGLKIYTHH